MLDAKVTSEAGMTSDGSCDVRIWSGDCKHSTYQYIGDKYQCDVCETIPVLNHEVCRAALPYVSGDYDNLS
jgi:hypothetical protein